MTTENQSTSRKLVLTAVLGCAIGLAALGAAYHQTSHATELSHRDHTINSHHARHDHRPNSRAAHRNFGEHIEGRLAFLKVELAITDAQSAVWETFADTLRAQVAETKALRESRSRDRNDRPRLNAVERLERAEQRLSRALANQRQLKTTIEPLYAALSEDQKRVADKLLRFGRRARG